MDIDLVSGTGFDRARREAFWRAIAARIRHRPNQLLSWEHIEDELLLRGEIARDLQAVPITRIVGSVGRYRDFDRAFLPRKSNLGPRWASIARAYDEGASLPPVSLYQVGDAYFAVDGHHRISVARARGATSIDAYVTKVRARVSVTAEMDERDLEIQGEYTRFLEHTHLDRLVPDQNIQFSACGGYQRLLEQIAVHRHSVAEQRGHPIVEDEAVRDWYENEYLPLVEIIRHKDILAGFPGRTEADLYLWITDHQHHLRDMCGPTVGLERAAAHFAARRTAGPLKRAVDAVQEVIGGVDCAWPADEDGDRQ